MHTLLKSLESNAGTQVQEAVAQLAAQSLPQAALALCAVAWHRWARTAPAALGTRYQKFQAIYLGWRAVDD